MSQSALSIEQHFRWMLCYIEVLERIAMLVATSHDVPQLSHFAAFHAFAIDIGLHMQAQTLAVRAALAPDALRKEAPWV